MAEELDLQKMRYDSLIKITRAMGGAALSGAVPTPTLELAKQLGISIADAWMCFDIYKTYFEKDLSKQELSKMLQLSGVVILGGGLAGYVGIRLAQAVLSEILDQLPIANSLITGIAFGSSTLIIGLAWLSIVEQSFFQQNIDES